MAFDYVVQQGDCISSVAYRFGFFPDTLWNHPGNSSLKRQRRDPNVLLAGDVIHVPDLRGRQLDVAAAKRHRFRRKGVPEKLRIRIEDEEGNPVADAPYTITIDHVQRSGTTDSEGWVIEGIAPDAQNGRLVVGPKGHEQEHELKLGHLDPIEELTGVQARLRNLGYDCPVDGELGEETREALLHFQRERALEETGEPDDTTREALQAEHKS